MMTKGNLRQFEMDIAESLHKSAIKNEKAIKQMVNAMKSVVLAIDDGVSLGPDHLCIQKLNKLIKKYGKKK
jgi:hypothetical protein